jgi:hypothetical protein
MSVSPTTWSAPIVRNVPAIENGGRLDQPTFHTRYEEMPQSFRAEPIGGTVYVKSPHKADHGRLHGLLMLWFDGPALFRGDVGRVIDVLNMGLPTPEHAAFVRGNRL